MTDYRVLLVEDNDLIRDMFAYGVRKYFRAGGGRVIVDMAGDGELAWRMLQVARYDLAIVDYYLPILNGGELIERMRREPRTRAIPVMSMSVGGDEARAIFMAAGADLFVPKPMVLKDLFATLERLRAERSMEQQGQGM